LELIKDYDLGINYHPDKANVVADALSRRTHLNMLLCHQSFARNLRSLILDGYRILKQDSTLEQDIQKGQLEDAKIQKMKEQSKEDKAPRFSVDEEGTLWYKKRFYVPKVKEIRELILREAHDSAYSIHPGSTKMYHDLKEQILVVCNEESCS
jgi:hypothetical protein